MSSHTYIQTLPTVKEHAQKGVNQSTIKRSSSISVSSLGSRQRLRRRSSTTDSSFSSVPRTRETIQKHAIHVVDNTAGIPRGVQSSLIKSRSCDNLSVGKSYEKKRSGGFDRESNITSFIDTVANVNKDNNALQEYSFKKQNGYGKCSEKIFSKKASSSNMNKSLDRKPMSSLSANGNTAAQADEKTAVSEVDKHVTNMHSLTSQGPSTPDLTSTTKGVTSSSTILARRSISSAISSACHKKIGSVVQSMSSQPPANRLSFSSVTKRVTTLLKFRRGFLPRGSGNGDYEQKPPSPPPEPLPTKPRFSAFMSAEAQFALLKGYEDILAEKLVDQFPTEGPLIRRTKTPRHSIAISEFGNRPQGASSRTEKRRSWGGVRQNKDGNSAEEKNDQKNFGEIGSREINGEKPSNDELDSSHSHAIYERKGIILVNSTDNSTKTVAPENGESHNLNEAQCMKKELSRDTLNSTKSSKDTTKSEDSIAKNKLLDEGDKTPSDASKGHVSPSSLENPLVSYLSVSKTDISLCNHNQEKSLGLQDMSGGRAGLPKSLRARRTSSLPEVVSSPRIISRHLPRERLLTMTHRLEKAMDILDVLRSDTELALSPRVKGVPSETNQRQQCKQQQRQQQGNLLERRQSQGTGRETLRDFKRWAGQWSQEFQANSAN